MSVELKGQIDEFHSNENVNNLANTEFDLKDIATIAANNDVDLGSMIADMFKGLTTQVDVLFLLRRSLRFTTYGILEVLSF